MAALLETEIWADYRGGKAVLNGVRLEIAAGETLALIGQSGSGKSTFAMAILRLLDWKGGKVRGRIQFDGRDLTAASEREMRSIRGKEIALILQSAASALNPMLRLGTQFEEAWKAHSREPWKTAGVQKASQLLREVDLNPEEILRKYPREVSLGQAQRVLIAMSLLHDPKLLLADEPTSALDVIVQKEVLDLIRRMTASRRMATLFISHDLLSVAALCDRVAILHHGAIVECAATADIFANPKHPYSQKLIGALPVRPQFPMVDLPSSLVALAESTAQSEQVSIAPVR
ncbi:hypothetical protein F183_A15770 [Bryobacterales bacterium F-183]|nr:hypothetical protein F183_A15770 [Bryobacterales bacterium F-183]